MPNAIILARDQITLERVVDINGVYRYYLVQSSTLNPPQKPTTFPPTGNWDDVEPGYTPGSTVSLYTVECTTFSNGTFEYTPVTLSSNYEAAKQAANSASAAMEAAEAASQEASSASSAVASLSLDYNQIKTEVINARGDKASLSVRIGEISSTATSANGTASTALQTANAITTEVRNATGTGSTLKQKIDGISSEVSTVSGVASSASQKADAITSEVRAATGTGSTLSQTLNGITSRVTTTEGNVSTLSTNVSGVTSRVSTAEGNISSLSTSINGISSRVTSAEGNITSVQQTTSAIQLKVNSAIDSNNNAKGLDTSNSSGTGTSVRLTNSDISFNIPGENGDTKWDNSGMTIMSINSPSVQPMFWTASSEESLPISIAISDTPVTGADTYGSLTEVFSMLSGKNIPPYGISIVVYKDLFEQDIQLHNVGGGQITISNTGGHVVSGDMTFEYATAPITIDSVKMTAARNIHVLQFNHCNDVTLNRVSITGDLTTAPQRAGVRMQSSNVVATECDISNTYNAFYALVGSHLVIDSCVGSGNARSFNGGTGAIISLRNTIPNYTSKKHNSDGSTLIVDNGNAVPTSGSGGDDPVVTTTVTLNAAIMRTRNDGGWMTGTQLKSGWYSGAGKHYGLCVFDISALVNKGYTLKTATLKFKRLSGVGAGASSVVYIGASTNSSASGGVNAVKASNGISVAQNSTVTATLTTSVAQGLLDGTYKSLCFVHPTDDSKYGSAPYSRNYMGIDTASASLPKLTLTYTT